MVSLPPELLEQICLCLDAFDVVSVGRTFNRTLYSIACGVIDRHHPWLNNALRMSRVWPARQEGRKKVTRSSFPGSLPAYTLLPNISHGGQLKQPEQYGLDPGKCYVQHTPPDFRGWLQFDGSLDWLFKREEIYALLWKNEDLETPDPLWRVELTGVIWWIADESWEQLRRLHLSLPIEQEKLRLLFLLHPYFHAPDQSLWRLASSAIDPVRSTNMNIMKCPEILDGGGGGYLVTAFDTLGDRRERVRIIYLYMNTTGAHCVLMGPASDPFYRGRRRDDVYDGFSASVDRDWSYDTALEKAVEYGLATQEEVEASRVEGVPLALNWHRDLFELQAFDLEEFIAAALFESELIHREWWSSDPNIAVPTPLMEYVRRVYKATT